MPFHPEALDLAQLKRLAKNLKRGSEAVLPNTPLTLSQSQELLARALGHPHWHAAVEFGGRNAASTHTAPALDRGATRPWAGLDELFFHERILLGSFQATMYGEHDQAQKIWQVAHYEDTQGLMRQRLRGAGLDELEDVQREIARAPEKYTHEHDIIQDLLERSNYGETTVGDVLRAVLTQARRVRVVPTSYFLWLKELDPGLWETLRHGKGAGIEDPLTNPQRRLELMEDLNFLMETGIPFLDAVKRAAETYGNHGQDNMARSLESWIQPLSNSKHWPAFFAETWRQYSPRQAIMFDLTASSSSGQSALTRIISEARREIKEANSVVVNNAAFPVSA